MKPRKTPVFCIIFCVFLCRCIQFLSPTSWLFALHKLGGSDVTVPSFPLKLILAFLCGSLSTATDGIHEQPVPLLKHEWSYSLRALFGTFWHSHERKKNTSTHWSLIWSIPEFCKRQMNFYSVLDENKNQLSNFSAISWLIYTYINEWHHEIQNNTLVCNGSHTLILTST